MIEQEQTNSHRLSPNFTGEQPHRPTVASTFTAYHSAAHTKRKRDPADLLSSALKPSHKRTVSEGREDSPACAGRGPSSSVDGGLQLQDDDDCLSLVHNYRRSRLYRQDTLPSSNRSCIFALEDDDEEEEDEEEEDEERRASPMNFLCIKRATTICDDGDEHSRFDDPPEVRAHTSSPQEPVEAEHAFSSSLISSPSLSPQSAYSSSLSSASPDSSLSMWQEGRAAEDVEERDPPQWLSAPSGSAFQAFRLPRRNADWSEKSCFRRATFTGFHRGSS